MKECTICSSSRSNYKCAKCRVPYCSVTCYTAHKELCSPLQIVVSESAVIADVQGELGILDKHTTAKSSTSLGVFKGNYTSSSSGVQSPEDGILHKIQLTALDEDAEIQILLRSHRLGEHILYIDSAPDRSRALKRLRESHPEFEYFVDKILKTCTASEGKVGVEKNRQHALKEDLKALVKQAEEEARGVVDEEEEDEDCEEEEGEEGANEDDAEGEGEEEDEEEEEKGE